MWPIGSFMDGIFCIFHTYPNPFLFAYLYSITFYMLISDFQIKLLKRRNNFHHLQCVTNATSSICTSLKHHKFSNHWSLFVQQDGPVSVEFHHKGLVIPKVFPCHDTIMQWREMLICVLFRSHVNPHEATAFKTIFQINSIFDSIDF